MASWPDVEEGDGYLYFETYLDLLRGRKLDRRKPPSKQLKVRVRVALVDGEWALVGLELLAQPKVHGADTLEWSTSIDSTDVRALKPAELVEAAVNVSRNWDDAMMRAAADLDRRVPIPEGTALVASERHYRDVAQVYIAAEGVRPLEAVAEQFDLTMAQAARHVAQARHKYGFILPTGRAR